MKTELINDFIHKQFIFARLGCKRSLVQIQSRRPFKPYEIISKFLKRPAAERNRQYAVNGQYRAFPAIRIKGKLGELDDGETLY